VENAIRQGFKIDGKGNRIPVEKFSKATGTGRHAKHGQYNPDVKINDLEFQTVPPILDQMRKIFNDPENKAKRDFLPHEHPDL
jgi:hypothetical protein